ncbi:MAG TPA: type II secretion system F family protein [bacterium]|jgi:type IV pilus assembly protein PilC|nr:type II secretion system F family protein [bacterium]HOF79798.1 type II secretion system F family protein [bacterium]HOH85676.1 type II secretion system F family protein [bacterium]HOQ91955.1 type II secretion system F family protein [bacterium]HPL22446.1 type II secretion system F family protein [bacterium]
MIFRYEAIDSQGVNKVGLVEADTSQEAILLLNENGLSLLKLDVANVKTRITIPFLNRVSMKDVVVFARQFSIMISAGIAMVQALRILVNQTENPNLKKVIIEIADEVDGGATLSDCLAKRPKIFSNFFVSVTKSGERSGKLDEVLNYLADEIGKDYDMIAKIRGAMIYPAVVLVGMFAIGVVMMVFVLPKLMDVLTETGTALPLATRILIAVSNAITGYWWLILILFGGLIAAIRMALASRSGRRVFDVLVLRLPVFGKLFQKILLVRFCRSMNTLLLGGVTIENSLAIAGDVVSNLTYKDLIEKTIHSVEDGNSISTIFLESSLIPKMVSYMMQVGEESGKLDVIFNKVAEFYNREIDNMLANMMSLLEPLVMILIGVGVGIMVAAVIMPMYSMVGNF